VSAFFIVLRTFLGRQEARPAFSGKSGVVTTVSESQLRDVTDRVVRECGCELVELVYRRGGGRWTVRVDIDRPGTPGVGIEDCQRVSRALEEVLDERDLIPGSYNLEVSSPGVDRPIRTADDVRRNAGRAVTVLIRDEAGGERTVEATLQGLENDELVLVEDGGGEVRIPMDRVVLAHQQLPF
jgi:ribosome maturation factor RimP